ncbi:MAG: N,N'-diacetylchitobiose phosphorylase [Clostridiales bacterium]|jgi:N,N'-diacetylchitobiose phosphorylase|nr:N,N'-diacetylchitobiose phosphorylase [Clostridiales bacterium]
MRCGTFDTENREYVIDRVDAPVSWTNYLGTEEMGAVVSQNAGGYLWVGSAQYGRVTRFRPNGVPLDRPGYYVYLRDDADGDYWSVSWQPVGKPLEKAKYACRHGLSYSAYECEYRGIRAKEVLFIPRGDNVLLWDVEIENRSDRPRALSAFGYVEFSFHVIDMDNQNFQMSLYATGSRCVDGCVEYSLHYENLREFFAASFEPDGFDCVRDAFLGSYRTETNPVAAERGELSGSFENGGNHCGALMKRIALQPGEKRRLIFFLGEGDANAAKRAREFYTPEAVDRCFSGLRGFWDAKLRKLQVSTPNENMNISLNQWNLYQSEVNLFFSRFTSFIEVGGRTGLGYRDTAQDSMCVPHSNPEMSMRRIRQLLRGQVSAGYGLHLFDPDWFDENAKQRSPSPTVVPTAGDKKIIHGLEHTCADDALWLIPAIVENLRESGDFSLLDEVIPYADAGEGTVLDHMRRILDFSWEQRGVHGVCKGLRADWNDCLNLGGGESAMVSFLYVWAGNHFLDLMRYLGKEEELRVYGARNDEMKRICREVLWDGKWFLRGITRDGRPIGSDSCLEGKVHLESNAWAVCSDAVEFEQANSAMDAVDEYLFTEFGLMLNAPSFRTIDDGVGFVTRVFPGVKENGSIFSHPNPWAWVAMAKLGRGTDAMRFYDALLPENQNDRIEIRQSEPYAYCQFVMGKDHTAFGRARHPWMTGSAGWAYYAATRYMLGVRPGFDELVIDPCVPGDWREFRVLREWRGVLYDIIVQNPDGVEKGVREIRLDGEVVDRIPALSGGGVHWIEVAMGVRE